MSEFSNALTILPIIYMSNSTTFTCVSNLKVSLRGKSSSRTNSSKRYSMSYNVKYQQYAHRFMNWEREAKHLHGHSGLLTIELEDEVDPITGFAHLCKDEAKKAWEVIDHFHHLCYAYEAGSCILFE